jgi:hypothetical protein
VLPIRTPGWKTHATVDTKEYAYQIQTQKISHWRMFKIQKINNKKNPVGGEGKCVTLTYVNFLYINLLQIDILLQSHYYCDLRVKVLRTILPLVNTLPDAAHYYYRQIQIVAIANGSTRSFW